MNNLVGVTAARPLRFEPMAPPAPIVYASEPSAREHLGMFLRHGLKGLAVGASVCALVIGGALLIKPSYTASGAVLIQPRRENLARTQTPADGEATPDTSAVDTQVEVLRSRALAEAVVRSAKLYADPEFNPHPTGAGSAAPSPADVTQATDVFLARAQARRAGLTYVVNLAMKSHDPAKAATIVNAWIDSYMKEQLQQKVSAFDKARTELDANLERLRQEAETAEARVENYKIANHLFSVGQSSMAEQEVSTLDTQIAAAKAEAADKNARLGAALAQVNQGGGGADVGAALGSDTIKELRKKEADASLQLAQLQADFKPDYPPVVRTQAELNDIHAQIQREINRILSSLRAEALASQQREASLLGSRNQAQGGLASNNMAQVGLLGLQQRADATKAIYEGYLKRANEVATEGDIQQADATIASPATPPIHPSSPNMRLVIVAGALLGVIGAFITILLSEFSRRGMRTGLEVERRLGLPFAAAIPDLRSLDNAYRRRRDMVPAAALRDQPLSGFAEAFRNVRAFLAVTGAEAPFKLVAVTSALPGEGKSSTALCLAATLAHAGAKVVIMDCDIRRRGLTRMTGCAEAGLVDVVAGEASLADVLVFDDMSGAWVLPVGGSRRLPADLFNNAVVEDIISALTKQFDHVVMDLAPVLGVADTRILAARADRVVFVTKWEKTPTRTAEAAVEILRASGSMVSGVILNQVNVKHQAKYGYGDNSDYFQYYRDYYLPA